MKAGATAQVRRNRVPRDTYRSTARSVGIAPRLRRRTLVLDAAILAVAGAFLIMTGPVIGTGVADGIREITASVSESIGGQLGTAQIELPSGAGNVVSAEPVVNGLPDFTREAELSLSGRVPSFALAPGRSVEIVLNAAVVANAQLDDTGTFAATLTLKDGANAIGLSLLSGKDVVARSAYTVILDREPPTLELLAPTTGATVEGPNVIVQGKTEVGAVVTVNGRFIVPGQDGSFSRNVHAAGGPSRYHRGGAGPRRQRNDREVERDAARADRRHGRRHSDARPRTRAPGRDRRGEYPCHGERDRESQRARHALGRTLHDRKLRYGQLRQRALRFRGTAERGRGCGLRIRGRHIREGNAHRRTLSSEYRAILPR